MGVLGSKLNSVDRMGPRDETRIGADCRTGLGQQFDAKLGYGVKCYFEKLEREPSVIARARRPWGIRVHPPLSMRAL
jgi:hypothetical protein